MHMNDSEKFLALGKSSTLLTNIITIIWNLRVPGKNLRELGEDSLISTSNFYVIPQLQRK